MLIVASLYFYLWSNCSILSPKPGPPVLTKLALVLDSMQSRYHKCSVVCSDLITILILTTLAEPLLKFNSDYKCTKINLLNNIPKQIICLYKPINTF